jgi:hypothetical protein
VTKAHTLSSYKDGHITVTFCKVCGAEDLELFADCPLKVIHANDPKPIDVAKQTDK